MKYNNIKVTFNRLGFSIVELLIAIFIGIILMLGLVSVFNTTSLLNKTQNGLARLQENGRYALLHIKQNLEQAGYQGCLGSSIAATATDSGKNKLPIVVYTTDFAPGFPTRADVVQIPAAGVAPQPYLIDPAYFIHGHECTGGSCSPSLTSLGTPTTIAIPNVGVADGDRIQGTDVLTFRYFGNVGREIKTAKTDSSGNVNITFSDRALLDTQFAVNNSKVVLASCSRDDPTKKMIRLNTSSVSTATSAIAPSSKVGITYNQPDLASMYSVATAINSMTYYVGNQKVDGRDIPTLYNIENGVKNAVVQGVDRFDVLYAVRLPSGRGTMILDAQGVQDLPVSDCIGNVQAGSGLITLIPSPGCGWRGVISMEVHLLLNTIYNSSTSVEMFKYSIDGDALRSPSDLESGIQHYNLHRREFSTIVTMKNE